MYNECWKGTVPFFSFYNYASHLLGKRVSVNKRCGDEGWFWGSSRESERNPWATDTKRTCKSTSPKVVGVGRGNLDCKVCSRTTIEMRSGRLGEGGNCSVARYLACQDKSPFYHQSWSDLRELHAFWIQAFSTQIPVLHKPPFFFKEHIAIITIHHSLSDLGH